MKEYYDDEAEKALLGVCMTFASAVTESRVIVRIRDFGNVAYGQMYEAQCALVDDGVTSLDPIMVREEMTKRGWTAPSLEHMNGLANMVLSPSNAKRYAREIVKEANRRRLLENANMLQQSVKQGTDVTEVVEEMIVKLSEMIRPEVLAPGQDIDSFVNEHDTDYDWLIPEFLERRDRMIVVGGEGSGKSTLLRQIAVQAAAGIHPWTEKPMEPCNVTLIDLENSPRMVSRSLKRLRVQAYDLNTQRLRIHGRPQGLNLSDIDDRRWLVDQCRADGTELLVIGPLYRMTSGVAERGDIGGEDMARNAAVALDMLRYELGVTLLMETHAPHGGEGGRALRPFGSSLWLRWPEFGVSISLDEDDEMMRRYKLRHWRGPRDERIWPRALLRGAGRWPWTPEGVE